MPFEIDKTSLDRFLGELEKLPLDLEKASQDALSLVRPALQDYAPERPGQRYRRSYELRGGWGSAIPEFQAVGGLFEFEATLENPVEYASWVQEQGMQAQIHEGRWQADQVIVDQHEMEILATYDRYVQEALDKIP
jgi:hypothetical protein